MVDLAERFRLAEEIDSSNYIWNLDYLTDGNIVLIRHVDKPYSIPYVCVNRDQGRRYFELLRPEFNKSNDSKKLTLSQREKDGNNFLRFEVTLVLNLSLFQGWHHRDGYNRKDVVIK